MAIVFFFKVCRYFDVDKFMSMIYERGDFNYKYRASMCGGVWILRVYILSRLNDVLIDLLNHEFSQENGYSGYLKITREILNNCSYNHILDLKPSERMVIRKLCIKQEEYDYIIDLMANRII